MTVLTTGIDPFTDRPLTKSTNEVDKALAKAEYIAKTIGPAAAQNVDKIYHAIKGDMDKQGRAYSPLESVMSALGVKIMPINVTESYRQNVAKTDALLKQNASAIREAKLDKRMTPDERKSAIESLLQDRKQITANQRLVSESYGKIMKDITK